MGGEGGEGLVMKVMGPCVRCEMININQDTGFFFFFFFFFKFILF